MKKNPLNLSFKDRLRLQERYLVWLHKTTKEKLDRVNRKFTQLDIDKYILRHILTGIKPYPITVQRDINRHLIKFTKYISEKESSAYREKFADTEKLIPKAECIYLDLKLKSIEKVIKKLKGAKYLNTVKQSYQKQMIKRIIEQKEEEKL